MRKNPDGPITLPIHAGDLEARVRAIELALIPDVDLPDPVYAVFAKMTGGQSIAPATIPPIAITAVTYDHGGWTNLVADPTLFTVPVDGYYTVQVQFEWNAPAVAGERREVALNLQGDPWSNGYIARENTPTINGLPTSQQVVLSRFLAQGSTLQACVIHGSAAAFTLVRIEFAATLVTKA